MTTFSQSQKRISCYKGRLLRDQLFPELPKSATNGSSSMEGNGASHSSSVFETSSLLVEVRMVVTVPRARVLQDSLSSCAFQKTSSGPLSQRELTPMRTRYTSKSSKGTEAEADAMARGKEFGRVANLSRRVWARNSLSSRAVSFCSIFGSTGSVFARRYSSNLSSTRSKSSSALETASRCSRRSAACWFRQVAFLRSKSVRVGREAAQKADWLRRANP